MAILPPTPAVQLRPARIRLQVPLGTAAPRPGATPAEMEAVLGYVAAGCSPDAQASRLGSLLDSREPVGAQSLGPIEASTLPLWARLWVWQGAGYGGSVPVRASAPRVALGLWESILTRSPPAPLRLQAAHCPRAPFPGVCSHPWAQELSLLAEIPSVSEVQ